MVVEGANSPEASPEAAAAAKARFDAIAQVSLQAQLVHHAFRPLWLNPQFADLFLYDSPDDVLVEQNIAHLFEEGARADPQGAWRRMIAGAGVFGRRTLHRRDGVAFRAEVYARRIQWDGQEAMAVAILDVSCEERAIVDLAEARREAEESTLARRQLLAAAAEDLQTPLLEAIAALGPCMGAGADEGPSRNARAACRALLRHVDDAVAAAARDAAAHSTRPLPFDAAALVREAVDAEASDMSFNLEAPNAAALLGDRACVSALLRALLREGARRAKGRPLHCDAEIGAGGLSFSVHAAAPGAADDLHDGLRVARSLVAAMGGVVVERAEGAAWTAIAFAPLPLAAAMLTQNAAREVLVIDDQLGARRILEAALGALGHTPTLTSSGAEALELLALRSFDLVLCDLNMPRLDGCETARRIRRLPRPWSDLPIAAITASSAMRVREAVADAGMDALLEKPISLPRLERAIAMLAARRTLVEPAERGEVEHEHQHHEADNDPDRIHDVPAFQSPRRVSRGAEASVVYGR